MSQNGENAGSLELCDLFVWPLFRIVNKWDQIIQGSAEGHNILNLIVPKIDVHMFSEPGAQKGSAQCFMIFLEIYLPGHKRGRHKR